MNRQGWDVIRVGIRPHWGVAGLGLLMGLLWTAGKLAVPALIARTIDEGVVPRDDGALARDVAIVAGVGLGGALVAGLRRWYAQLLGYLVERDIRHRLVTHVYRLHLGFHHVMPSGVLVSRTGSDLLQIQQPFIGVPMLLSSVVMLVGSAVLLALIDLPLMLLALSPIVLILVVALRLTQRLGPQSERLQNELSGLAASVEESVSGINAVKGLGAEDVELRRLRVRTDRVFDTAMDLTHTRATHLPLFDFLPSVGLVATLWFGAGLVDQGRLTVGQLVQFNAYVLMLIGPMRMLGMTLSQLQRALVSASLIGEILAVEPDIADPADPTPLRRHARPHRAQPAALRLEGVSFAYPGSNEAALEGIDLSLAHGETVAIVGATGSGKSTLASLVPRLNDPDAGRVLIDGIDVRDAALADVRRAVAVVFEDTLLFAGSIADNIRFAVPGATHAQVEAAARAAGAHDFISDLDGGYATLIGERGVGLSGGQRQRIGIARALLTEAPILVLDSATSAVDALKEVEIHSSIAQATSGRTTLVIAHRASVIALADRVVLLDEGRIADVGTHAELLARSALYRRILAHADQDDAGAGVAELVG